MALTDSLISHWALDEASGNALDSHGSNDLTETGGTIDSATGKVGNCRDFEEADTEWFEHADNASLSTGDIDFTFAAWVFMESEAALFGTILAKGSLSTNSVEYSLYYRQSVDDFQWKVGNGTASATVSSTLNVTTGTWYFVVAWHDSVNNLLGISVNDGAAVTASYSSGGNDNASAFMIGADSTGRYFDGLIDEVSFWKRVLTSDERTELYNAGAGLAYPWSAPAAGNRRRRVLLGRV